MIPLTDTAQKMKISIKGFFSKCDQIRSFLRIWSHLLNKLLLKDFIFCAVRKYIYDVAKPYLYLLDVRTDGWQVIGSWINFRR